MNPWFRIFLLITMIAVAKAHVRILMMAMLGLAGLWMIHVLAQDYQGIFQTASTVQKLLSKRSITENDIGRQQYEHISEVNWPNILSNDPVGCARSFICQLVAEESILDDEEKVILQLARHFHKEQRAKEELQNALEVGENHFNPVICQKKYFLCPYSRKTMMKLLQFFGTT